MQNSTHNEEVKVDQIVLNSVLDLNHDDKFLKNFPSDSKKIKGQGYYRLAKVYYDKSDLRKAEEFFLKALDQSEFPKDSFAILKAYGFLIRIYAERMDEENLSKFLDQGEKLIEKLGTELGSLNAEYFYNYAGLFMHKGNLEEALKTFKIAYQKAQTENEPELIAKSLYSMAQVSYKAKKFDEALSLLNQLSELLEILRKGYLKGSMFILYGNVYRELGQFDKSLASYDKAIKTLQNKTCWNLYPYILLYKGILLKKMGEFNKALVFFDLAENTSDEATFKRLHKYVQSEVNDVNDSSVDLYLDRHNRLINEKSLGTIDFKHRFVLLEILFLLARNSGKYYNKEDLAKDIWKDEYNPLIHDKLIYTSISRLRKLIEPKNGSRKYIIRGKDGYTFNPRINARFHKENEAITQKSISNVEISSPV